MNDNDKLTLLLNTYSPIAYLHTDEKYFPNSIEYILQNSSLKKKDGTILLNSPITSKQLYETYKDASGNNTEIIIPDDKIVGQNNKNNINQVPVYGYATRIGGNVYLFYSFLYSYNGPKKVAGIRDVGAHYGDLEHITVVLDQASNIKEIFYAAHSSDQGRWVKPDQVEFEGSHPIVYIANGSHASYPKEGVVFRFYGFGNDYTNKGLKWTPPVIRVYKDNEDGFNKDTMGWIYYGGSIGKDGVGSLGARDFLVSGDDRNNKSPPIISYGSWRYRNILFYTMIIGLLVALLLLSCIQKFVNTYLIISLIVALIFGLYKFTDNKLATI